MSQFSYPKCTDDMVRSPGYISRLVATIKGAFNTMGSTNFGFASVVPASLADDKGTIFLILKHEGAVTGIILDYVMDLVHIPEIENPADEGIELREIYALSQDTTGGNATINVWRDPKAGGHNLLTTLTFQPANSPREKVSDTVSQMFYEGDLLIPQVNVLGAGNTLVDPSIVFEFIVPHASP